MDYMLYIMDTIAFENDDEFERRLCLVSEYRRKKVLRLRYREDRNASLAAGFLLSHALRQYAGIDEKQVSYARNESGKPTITGNINFSISHTEGCVAVIVGKNICGIDVERVRRIPDSIVKRMYSKEDADNISRMDKNGDAADVYSTCVWTRREAYGKMTGTGLLMSDNDQKMVMKDDYMSGRHVSLINYGVEQKKSGEMAVLNDRDNYIGMYKNYAIYNNTQNDIEKNETLIRYIVAAAVDVKDEYPDIQVVDSRKLRI